jgi:hypothetical protein
MGFFLGIGYRVDCFFNVLSWVFCKFIYNVINMKKKCNQRVT